MRDTAGSEITNMGYSGQVIRHVCNHLTRIYYAVHVQNRPHARWLFKSMFRRSGLTLGGRFKPPVAKIEWAKQFSSRHCQELGIKLGAARIGEPSEKNIRNSHPKTGLDANCLRRMRPASCRGLEYIVRSKIRCLGTLEKLQPNLASLTKLYRSS